MFDFIKEAAGSKLYNFHSHTQFCDGRDTMRNFAAAAVAAGFTHYGFTPHSPVPISSPCNMQREQVDEYMLEVCRIKELYGNACHFYTGMEIDYLGPGWGPSHAYFAGLGLDYAIGSIHFIPTQRGHLIDVDGSPERFIRNMGIHFNNDIRYVVETFYAQTFGMLERGGFDIIGHFDKIALNASAFEPGITAQPWYDALVRDAIRLIARKGVTVEINTKAYERFGCFFPSQNYFEDILRAGIPVIVNSDAHYTALINASRPTALNLLEKAMANAVDGVSVHEG